MPIPAVQFNIRIPLELYNEMKAFTTKEQIALTRWILNTLQTEMDYQNSKSTTSKKA